MNLMRERANFPCKGCEERYVGCHSTCERYLIIRAEYDKVAAQIDEIKKNTADIENFKVSAVMKMNERMRRKRRK